MRVGGAATLVLYILVRMGIAYWPEFDALFRGRWVHSIWIPALFIWAWVGYRINCIRWKVKRENYLLCMNCLYSLKGLESPGKCPECGTPYNVEILKKEWISNLKKAPF